LLPLLLNKLAAEEPTLLERAKKLPQRVTRRLRRIGETDLTKRQLQRLQQELREVKPKSTEERRVESLAGRKMTSGQLVRRSAIGAGVGALTHVVGTGIEGAPKGKFLRTALRPRSLARSGSIGALYGAAIPVAVRLADIEAAKSGKF